MQKTITLNSIRQFTQEAEKIARNSGMLMTKYQGYSGPRVDRHTSLDKYISSRIESRTSQYLKKRYPEHGLFGASKNRDYDFEWICDYIDGAYSYGQGYKISVTSVALTYKSKTIAAAVYNPWTDEMYVSGLGLGVYINGKKLKTLSSSKYQGKLVDVEWWPHASYDLDTWLHDFSIKKDVYVLHIGSIIHAACLVASGQFVAAVLGKFMQGKNHEIAAIKLIIEESGCKLTDLHGNKITHIGDIEGLVFANKSIHETLIQSYKEYVAENK